MDARLDAALAEHPRPLLFVTVSGAHLYGFPSPDSDYDLRGVHLLPLETAVGLHPDRGDTLDRTTDRDGLEIDLVTHDLKKFIGLMLKKNGYVLEQLLSPLVLRTSPVHEELKRLAPACITRHHAHHYLGFAHKQWTLFQKENPPRVKPLLYVYRVLLTGLHLMRTGEVQANLVTLNDTFGLHFLPDLIARKLAGPEKSVLTDADITFHRRQYELLRSELETARDASDLPHRATATEAMDDLLVRTRLTA